MEFLKENFRELSHGAVVELNEIRRRNRLLVKVQFHLIEGVEHEIFAHEILRITIDHTAIVLKVTAIVRWRGGRRH